MADLDRSKLATTFIDAIDRQILEIPRVYTLTHSDTSGDLFLSIGTQINHAQISGWYTRLMRDEVWAEWRSDTRLCLRVHCHVSGGMVFGSPAWRYRIFNQHLKQVLQAFRFGDRLIFENDPSLDAAPIAVRFHARQPRFDQLVEWQTFGEYRR